MGGPAFVRSKITCLPARVPEELAGSPAYTGAETALRLELRMALATDEQYAKRLKATSGTSHIRPKRPDKHHALILHRLGSYARQHIVHQALNEIGRVERTLHILRTIDDEEFRRQQSRELNKGEAAHDLSRFLFFGKEGALRGQSFDDQFRSFSCLGVLHNAVVAWNIIHIGKLVEQLRAEGHVIDDSMLAHTSPLMRKHLNPFGRYQFDLDRMRQTGRSNLQQATAEQL